MRLAVLTLVLASLSLGLQAAPKRTSKKTASRSASRPDSGAVHVIRKGETAAAVARANGLSLAELRALNPGRNLSRLSIGARVKVGRAKGPAAIPASNQEAGLLPLTPVLRAPLTALPAAPAFGPAPMPHLERLLPFQVRSVIPSGDASASFGEAETHQAPETPSQLLARMQPVLPPVSEAELNALLPTFVPADPARLDLLWPVETRTISSGWGPRMRTRVVRVKNKRKKRVRYKGRHRGLDLNAPTGTAVFAAMDGQVVLAGRHRQYGNYVVVEHGNGVTTLYAHHHLNLVQAGDIVRRGQKIAEVGRTGNATGPHLHFELKVDGVHRNPLPVLNDEEEIPAEIADRNAEIGSGSRR